MARAHSRARTRCDDRRGLWEGRAGQATHARGRGGHLVRARHCTEGMLFFMRSSGRRWRGGWGLGDGVQGGWGQGSPEGEIGGARQGGETQSRGREGAVAGVRGWYVKRGRETARGGEIGDGEEKRGRVSWPRQEDGRGAHARGHECPRARGARADRGTQINAAAPLAAAGRSCTAPSGSPRACQRPSRGAPRRPTAPRQS